MREEQTCLHGRLGGGTKRRCWRHKEELRCRGVEVVSGGGDGGGPRNVTLNMGLEPWPGSV